MGKWNSESTTFWFNSYQRRIFTDLPKDDIRDDSELGLQCLDIAIGYILNGLATSWEKLIGKCDEHISILVRPIATCSLRD